MLQTKLKGLKIMLQYGHFLGVVLPEQQADKTVADYQSDKIFKKEVTVYSGTCFQTGMNWVLAAESVIGMHTFSIEAVQQEIAAQQQQKAGITPGTKVWQLPKSGFGN